MTLRKVGFFSLTHPIGFYVNEEAAEFLRGIKEKVGVIGVAGKYRTGKSFLLNRIVLNKQKEEGTLGSGFGVGPTINPCTKGLWIWNQTITTEYKNEKMKTLVIDSEGIGGFDEDQNHDSRIFLLVLLLSSYFIYNSVGTIDQSAIDNLSLIVNLSKQIQVSKNAKDNDEQISNYFPSFLWVVRDFTLKLIDTMGNSINQKEYLEEALKP